MVAMREVCLLIGKDDAVLWSDASDSPVALPDSRTRWEAIWSHRDLIVEIAHSHPGGPRAFSREDETTMAALVSALGRPITFSVVAPKGMVRCTIAPDATSEHYETSLVECEREPWWASLLRLASGINRSMNHKKEE
jgi:hypothetical protein